MSRKILYIYDTKIIKEGSDDCLKEHKNGCGSRCNGKCNGTVHNGKDDPKYDRNNKLYEYHAWHICNAVTEYNPNGEDGKTETYGARVRQNYTKCAVCGSTSQADNGDASIWQLCNGDGLGHYLQGTGTGAAYCTKCGAKAGSNAEGVKCTRSYGQNRNVGWSTNVQYTYVSGGAKSENPTGTSTADYLCKYGSSATITITASGSDQQKNHIVGYKIYTNGVEGSLNGTTNKADSSTLNYWQPTLNISSVDTVYEIQFVLYTTGGTAVLPVIRLLPGVHVYVDDTISSSYTTRDNTSWYSWLDKATVGDLINSDMTNRDKSRNVGLYRITSSAYGGNDHYSSGGEYDTYYLFDWTDNATLSTSTGEYEPYEGSGQTSGYNHYHRGYIYKSATSSIIDAVDYGTTLLRYFTPMTYKVIFNGNEYTGYNGANYTTGDMGTMTFTYDRGQYLTQNKFLREYYVTLKNAEPWQTSIKSSNGTTNTASRYVPYTFLGWNVGSALGTTPYYEYSTSTVYSTSDSSIYVPSSSTGLLKDKQSVGNLYDTNNGTQTLYATWQSSKILLPKDITGSNGYVFLNWSDKAYPDTRVYSKNIADNKDDVNYVVNRNTEYKPYKDTTLYAHWYKDVTLTFDLQGGERFGDSSDIVLEGTFYDYDNGYTFGILNNSKSQSKGHYDAQINEIDAYNTYDANGINNLYKKVDDNGVEYRLLGWSTNKNATVPDKELDVYSTSHTLTYNISDDTTLYAVWEPVLSINLSLDRTLGNITNKDGNYTKNSVENVTAVVSGAYVEQIIKPGEQGQYQIVTYNQDVDTQVEWDEKIIDIYTHDGIWKDNLNPSTSENSKKDDNSQGLNRKFTISNSTFSDVRTTRKFYMPQYIGTSQAYESSKDVNQYEVLWTFKKDSYYWETYKGQRETAEISGSIYITTDTKVTLKDIPSILSELRSRITL